jgi:CheY-like chemotaxis protein
MNFEDASILVVDDEPALCKIFAAWLERAGCRAVRTAKDGRDALAALQAEPAHLLITDIRMPNMDGLDLVRNLRGSSGPTPTILFVSGFGDVDKREMYDLGVEAFLSKPLDRGEFIDQAKRALMDKADLLSVPATETPRQSLLVEAATLVLDETPGDLTSVMAIGNVRLGRGGFSVSHTGALTPGKLEFLCLFPALQQAISGHGLVRWHARAEHAYGIEMTFLAEPGRSWFLDTLRSRRCHSFIPASPAMVRHQAHAAAHTAPHHAHPPNAAMPPSAPRHARHRP